MHFCHGIYAVVRFFSAGMVEVSQTINGYIMVDNLWINYIYIYNIGTTSP